MFVHQAAVVGAGEMGGEIAQAVAAAGLPVLLADPDGARAHEALEHARRVTGRRLDALVEKGRMEAEAADDELASTDSRMRAVEGFEGLGHVDLVVVCEPDGLDELHAVFGRLDAATPGHALLAAGVSTVRVADVALATGRPDRVVGLRFHPPASVVRVVEVVEAEDTSEDSVQAAADFVSRIGKQPVRCLDGPGLVVDRLLGALLGEAWRVGHERGMEPAELDAAVEASGVLPAGPNRLAERLGPRTMLALMNHLHEGLGPRFQVPAALEALAARQGTS